MCVCACNCPAEQMRTRCTLRKCRQPLLLLHITVNIHICMYICSTTIIGPIRKQSKVASHTYSKRMSVSYQKDTTKKSLSVSLASRRNNYQTSVCQHIFVFVGAGAAGLFHSKNYRTCAVFFFSSTSRPSVLHNISFRFNLFVARARPLRCHAIGTCSLRCSFDAHFRAFRFVARTSHVHAHTYTTAAKNSIT